MAQEYITVEQARKDLGEVGFYALHRWLRDKGFRNYTQTGEASFKHEIFATKDQLHQFITEQYRGFKGNLSLTNIYGQTREYLSRYKPKRKK